MSRLTTVTQSKGFLGFSLLLILCLFVGAVRHHAAPPDPPDFGPLSGPPGVPLDPYALLPPSGPIRFTDVAVAAGIHTRWPHKPDVTLLESTGTGCAFLDFNNDGNLDILLIGPKLTLYQGDGKGHFTDVTQPMGLDTLTGTFTGCCVGDYDNDGYDDLYISGHMTGLLLHNEEGKRFTDVTAASGLKAQRWGTSCAFVDIDGDGYLDLFIANYLLFDPKGKPYCIHHGLKSPCFPIEYRSVAATLYHNLKGTRFEDVTRSWNVVSTGNGLGVACADYDGSGRPSVAVANDMLPGDLLHSDAKNRFVNWGQQAGVAGTDFGRTHAGMGIDWGDYDNDGQLDLFVATYQGEPRSLYRNLGNGLFFDMASRTGVFTACIPYLAFGTKFIDVDNDGWLDLLLANGHVEDKVQQYDPKIPFLQPTQLLYNTEGPGLQRRFVDLSAAAGLRALPPIMGRGLAIGDYDNDGRMDALVVNNDGAPQLLHNETQSDNHWLLCKLQGVRSNRNGIGALVTFTANGVRYLRRCSPDGSFESSSDMRVHCGLGNATSADIAVKWPSGVTDTYFHVAADHIVTLREGDSTLH